MRRCPLVLLLLALPARGEVLPLPQPELPSTVAWRRPVGGRAQLARDLWISRGEDYHSYEIHEGSRAARVAFLGQPLLRVPAIVAFRVQPDGRVDLKVGFDCEGCVEEFVTTQLGRVRAEVRLAPAKGALAGGRLDEARAAIAAALTADPDFPEAQALEVELLLAEGRREAALLRGRARYEKSPILFMVAAFARPALAPLWDRIVPSPSVDRRGPFPWFEKLPTSYPAMVAYSHAHDAVVQAGVGGFQFSSLNSTRPLCTLPVALRYQDETRSALINRWLAALEFVPATHYQNLPAEEMERRDDYPEIDAVVVMEFEGHDVDRLGIERPPR